MTKDLHELFHTLNSLQSGSRHKLALYLQHGQRVELSKGRTDDVRADAEVGKAQVSQGPVWLDGDHADVRLHCRHSQSHEVGRNTDLCLWIWSCKDIVTRLFIPPTFSLNVPLPRPCRLVIQGSPPPSPGNILFFYSNHSGLRFLLSKKADPCPSTGDMSGFPC